MVVLPSVVFVCPHGALKCRLAAAMFNAAAPPGWHATSAGLTPQAEVSVHAAPLLAGTPEAPWLRLDPPQGLTAIQRGTRVVSIDCMVDGAASWQLADSEPGAAMLGELRQHVERLLAEVTHDDH